MRGSVSVTNTATHAIVGGSFPHAWECLYWEDEEEEEYEEKEEE